MPCYDARSNSSLCAEEIIDLKYKNDIYQDFLCQACKFLIVDHIKYIRAGTGNLFDWYVKHLNDDIYQLKTQEERDIAINELLRMNQ